MSFHPCLFWAACPSSCRFAPPHSSMSSAHSRCGLPLLFLPSIIPNISLCIKHEGIQSVTHLSIYLSISNLYSASFSNILRGCPDPGPVKQVSLEQSRKSFWRMSKMRTDVKGQFIPDSMFNNRESPVLL